MLRTPRLATCAFRLLYACTQGAWPLMGTGDLSVRDGCTWAAPWARTLHTSHTTGHKIQHDNNAKWQCAQARQLTSQHLTACPICLPAATENEVCSPQGAKSCQIQDRSSLYCCHQAALQSPSRPQHSLKRIGLIKNNTVSLLHTATLSSRCLAQMQTQACVMWQCASACNSKGAHNSYLLPGLLRA